MSETEFIEELKEFCKTKKFEYRGRVQIGNTILVYIFGEKCIEPFNAWLSTMPIKSHTTPSAFDKEIGSYITLK